MGGKLTKYGVVLPENENVTQTKSILSVDGKEADETGNIDLGGAFDFVDKKTQIRGCKSLTWNTLRVQGLDDWERQRDSELLIDDRSLTISTLTGEYVYIAEVDIENKSSAYYRSDNGGATYSRHIVPTEGVDVKLIRTSETGQVVLLSTHIGGVLISEDYGKTWATKIITNSKSSWFISMSSNGQNLIYPNSEGNLYLRNHSFGSHNLFNLPITPNSIKELFVSNDTDRENIKMVMMDISGNVWTSINGGDKWVHSISGVKGLYTDKDVEIIYVIKGTTIQFRHIGGDGFSQKVDFKTYPKYKDLTEDPNDFYLSSIFVSKDYKTGEHKIAVFTVNSTQGFNSKVRRDDLIEDNFIDKDVVEGEDVLYSPSYEKVFTGILISEDSGNTWDLSQIKYTQGIGGTPQFLTWPSSFNYPRLQLIENFESGILLYNNNDSVKNGLNNIIRICDKSTSYSSTSKMILDGGITLGQSMESDTEYYNKMPGTIEYENYKDGYVFHFDKCTWVFPENETAEGSNYSALDYEILKPLTVTGFSDFYGKRVKNIQFSNTLTGMKTLQTKSLNSDIILMPPYTGNATPKLLEISNGFVRPSSINSSNIGGDCFIYTENSIPKEGYFNYGISSEVVLEMITLNLRWFEHDAALDLRHGSSHSTGFIYDEKNSQLIKIGMSRHKLHSSSGAPRPEDFLNTWGDESNIDWYSDDIFIFKEDKDHTLGYSVNGKRYNFSSKESIKLGLANPFSRSVKVQSVFPTFNVTPKVPKPGEYSPQVGEATKKTGAGFGRKTLIYNNNLYIFGGQLNYVSSDEPTSRYTEDYGFPFGKIDLNSKEFSLLKHPGSLSGDISTEGYTTNAEFTFPVAFFEYSGDLYVLIKVLRKSIGSIVEPPYLLYKYIISTDTWTSPKEIQHEGGLLLYSKIFPWQSSLELASQYLNRDFHSYDKAKYFFQANSLVTVLNVNDDIYFIRHGTSWESGYTSDSSYFTSGGHDGKISIGVYPKKSLVNTFNTGIQDKTGAIEVLGDFQRDSNSSLVGPAVCYDGFDNIIIHGGFRSAKSNRYGYSDSHKPEGTVYKWSISKKTFSIVDDPKIYDADSFNDFELSPKDLWEKPYPYFSDISPKRSFHTIITIQGLLFIFGGYHNTRGYEPGDYYTFTVGLSDWLKVDGTTTSKYTGKVYQHNDIIGKVYRDYSNLNMLSQDLMQYLFVGDSRSLYLTDDRGNSISSEYKSLYLHKLEEESSTDCNYTSLLVNKNVDNISSLESSVDNLDDRVTVLEGSVSTGSLIPLPQWSIQLSSTICPRIQYSGTTTDSEWYELNYDIFYDTLGLSSHPIPDRAILYVKIYTQSSATWVSTYVRMTGYDRVFYSSSATLNPPLSNYEEVLVETQGIQNTHSLNAWSGYLFPTWGNWQGSVTPSPSYRGRMGLTREHPRKLAVKWYGTARMTLLGYMMPDYTD